MPSTPQTNKPEVRDWSALTPAVLEREWARIMREAPTYNTNKLFWPYWLERLTRHLPRLPPSDLYHRTGPPGAVSDRHKPSAAAAGGSGSGGGGGGNAAVGSSLAAAAAAAVESQTQHQQHQQHHHALRGAAEPTLAELRHHDGGHHGSGSSGVPSALPRPFDLPKGFLDGLGDFETMGDEILARRP